MQIQHRLSYMPPGHEQPYYSAWTTSPALLRQAMAKATELGLAFRQHSRAVEGCGVLPFPTPHDLLTKPLSAVSEEDLLAFNAFLEARGLDRVELGYENFGDWELRTDVSDADPNSPPQIQRQPLSSDLTLANVHRRAVAAQPVLTPKP